MSRSRITLFTIAVVLTALCVSGSSLPAKRTSAAAGLQGDADCSQGVDPIDSLVIVTDVSGIADAPCRHLADVRCDGDVDIIDALQTLRFFGGLTPSQEPGCAEIGQLGPDPILIDVVLNPGGAVTKTVRVAGGELAAQAANGAKLILTIPAGALIEDVQVTITPVTSIGGLPLSGGLTAAVLVEPDDLLLTEPATLTIETTTVQGELEPIVFGFRDRQFFLLPDLEGADAANITATATSNVQVTGGGGYGVGQGTNADGQAVAAHPPTFPIDRYLQTVRDILRRNSVPPSPEGQAELNASAREFYESSISPMLAPAVNDCSITDRGGEGPARRDKLVLRYLRWLSLIQGGIVTDLFEQELPVITDALALGFAKCFNEAYARCVNGGDRRTEVILMFQYLGMVQGGIVAESADLAYSLMGDYDAKLHECLGVYKLYMDSTTRYIHASAGNYTTTSHVTAEVYLYRDEVSLAGSGNLFYESYTLDVDQGFCVWRDDGTVDGRISVVAAWIDPPVSVVFEIVVRPVGFELFACPSSFPIRDGGGDWLYCFGIGLPFPGGVVDDWEPGVAPVIARKEVHYDGPQSPGSGVICQEDTTFELRLAGPQP